MTIQEILTTTERAGIVLSAVGDRLRVKAPSGALTDDLRATLAEHKPALLDVLFRLEGMRANTGLVPIPCARLEAIGGPGRCFSCGDGLGHPGAYGRCVPCEIAAEL